MIYHAANFLCIFCGLTLFTLGSYGLLGVPKSELRMITLLLEPMGYSLFVDRMYLFFLALIGFWLTLRMNVRVPAAIGLGLVLGKMLFLNHGGAFSMSIAIALILILLSALLRLVFRRDDDDLSEHHQSMDPW